MLNSSFTVVLMLSLGAMAQTGTSMGTTSSSAEKTTEAVSGTTEASTATAGTGGTAAVAASGSKATLSTDGQIVKVLMTVNEGEAEAADIAVKKAKNKEVRDFAKMLGKHHRENKKQTKDLIKVTERDISDLSKSLKQESKDAIKSLKKESREGFDAAYLQAQISMHQKALNILDSDLIPNAKADSVRTHLMKTRESVSSHLTEAENLKTKLE